MRPMQMRDLAPRITATPGPLKEVCCPHPKERLSPKESGLHPKVGPEIERR